MASTIKIAIIDDKLREVENITHSLQLYHRYSIILKDTHPLHFFEQLIHSKQIPDILITDCQMPDIDGMALSRLVHLFLPTIKIIVVSGLLIEQDVAELLDIGVSAVIAKGSLKMPNQNILQNAIETIKKQKIFIDSFWDEAKVQTTLTDLQQKKEHNTLPHFTIQDQKIIQLLVNVPKYKDIAELMNITTRTVETHIKKMNEKANSANKTTLLTYGLKHFLIRVFRG